MGGNRRKILTGRKIIAQPGEAEFVGSSTFGKLKSVREWKKELRSVNPGWTDEKIEEQAIVLAEKEHQLIAAKKKLLSTRYT